MKILNPIALAPKVGIKCKSFLHLDSHQKKERPSNIFPAASHCPEAHLMHGWAWKASDVSKSSVTIAFYNVSSLVKTRSTASRVFSMLPLKANFASGSSLCTALMMRSKNVRTESVFRMPTITVDINQSTFGYLFAGSQRNHLLPTMTTSHFFSRSLVMQISNDVSGMRYSISQS